MADGKKYLVVQQLRTIAVNVKAADVADVIAVLFQEPHHRIFVGEVEVPASDAASGVHGAVVAHFVGAPVDGPLVEVGAAIRVVGLPGLVRCLENDR
ncbi:hypothetical protein PJL18_03794 [Paenarthrobacter nicotinovorans]|nr:hypothetical protein [Paenarthrobacter nicotinovorans]